MSAVGQLAATAVEVVIDDIAGAQGLLTWSAHQVARRHSPLHVLYIPNQRSDHPAPADPGQLRSILDGLGMAGHYTLEVARPGQGLRDIIEAALASDPTAMVVLGETGPATLVEALWGAQPSGNGTTSVYPLIVVPKAAIRTVPPAGLVPLITVGFHGSSPSLAALRWAVTEADRRDGLVRAVLAWSEAEYAGVDGSLRVDPNRYPMPGRAAEQIGKTALSHAGVPTERVTHVARRGTPTGVLVREALGSDLLVVGAGQSVVHHHRVLGAATLACVAHSPIPVVIVPHPGPTTSAEVASVNVDS